MKEENNVDPTPQSIHKYLNLEENIKFNVFRTYCYVYKVMTPGFMALIKKDSNTEDEKRDQFPVFGIHNTYGIIPVPNLKEKDVKKRAASIKQFGWGNLDLQLELINEIHLNYAERLFRFTRVEQMRTATVSESWKIFPKTIITVTECYAFQLALKVRFRQLQKDIPSEEDNKWMEGVISKIKLGDYDNEIEDEQFWMRNFKVNKLAELVEASQNQFWRFNKIWLVGPFVKQLIDSQYPPPPPPPPIIPVVKQPPNDENKEESEEEKIEEKKIVIDAYNIIFDALPKGCQELIRKDNPIVLPSVTSSSTTVDGNVSASVDTQSVTAEENSKVAEKILEQQKEVQREEILKPLIPAISLNVANEKRKQQEAADLKLHQQFVNYSNDVMKFMNGDCFEILESDDFQKKYVGTFRLIIFDPPWNVLKDREKSSSTLRDDDFILEEKRKLLPPILKKLLAPDGTLLIECKSVGIFFWENFSDKQRTNVET